MRVLVDTNVILRSTQPKNQCYPASVAAMERHGVMHLLTFNKSDFARFPSIAALSPDDIISGILPA
jgi:predicted nucleic acid-binding protein